MAKTRGKLIEDILKITGGDPHKHTDTLADKDVPYLDKLLKVIKALK